MQQAKLETHSASLGSSDNKHSHNISMFIVAGSIGASLSSIIAYWLIGDQEDLSRLIFAMPFGIIGSIAIALFVPSAKQLGLKSNKHKKFRWRKWKAKGKTLTKIILLVIFRSAMVMSFITFLPELFYQIQEKQGENATLYLGSLAITLFVATNALSGVIGSKLNEKIPTLYILLISFVLGLAAAWAFFQELSIIYLLLFGLSVNLSQAITISLAQKLIPENSATVSSLIMGFGWGFAILLMPVLGYFADMLGLQLALKFNTIVFTLLAILMSVLLRKDLLRKKLFQSLSFVFLLFALMHSSPAEAALVKISNPELNNNTLTVQHNSIGELQFKKRIYNLPPRFTFDILDADLDGAPQSFTVNDSNITEVRIGQFTPTTVRVVVEAKDTSSLEKIRYEKIGQAIFFQLGAEDVIVEDYDFAAGNLLIKANNALTARTIKLDKPERLVVDLVGAKLKSASLKRSFNNGSEQIKIAQFDKSIVRVVFSGKDAHKRKLQISEDQKQLVIEGEDHSDEFDDKDLKDKLYALSLESKSDEESVFLIKSTKELDYKFLKLHNPERLVVDLFGIAFEDHLVATQFSETSHVKDVRFGIATLGRPVTRIVFDLKQDGLLEEFSETADKKQLKIRILGVPASKTKDGGVVPQAYKSVGTKVVLDAGHGGYDPGASYGNRDEKDITLKITNKVKKYLEEAGIKVFMTRTEDRFVSLAERVEISNSIRPSLFVSIHVNALLTNTDMQGLQTYYYSSTGYKIGSIIHKQLLTDVGMPDQRVRKAAFWVCKYTAAPSILLELGFMTNVEERNKLASDAYQTELAKSVARGIIKYLEEK